MHKRLILFIVCSSLSLFAMDESAPPKDNDVMTPLSYGGSVEFESRYIWNGIDLSGGAVFQSSLWIGWHGFSAFVWTNIGMTDEIDLQGKVDEVDLGVAYTHAFNHMVLDLSFTYFVFPQGPKREVLSPGDDPSMPDTTLVPSLSYEAMMGLSTKFNVVNFALPIYLNLVHGSLYLGPVVRAGYTFEGIVRPEIDAKLGIAGKNFNDSQFGTGVVDEGTLSDFTTTFSLTSDLSGTLGKYLTIRGWVAYATLLNDDIRNYVSYDPDNFWGGVNVSVGF